MKQFKVQKQSITQRDSGLLNAYFNDISKFQPLSKEEELQLIRRFKQGDTAAGEKVLRANLKFVVSVAKKYRNQLKNINLQDLISEGNTGLIIALNNFNPDQNFKFITYAVWWIRQQIMQSISEKEHTIRLSANKTAILNKINRFVEDFIKEHGHQPNPYDISEKFNISYNDYCSIFQIQDIRSLQQTFATKSGEEDTSLEDLYESKEFPSPTDSLNEQDFKKLIQTVLKNFSKREMDTINAYFGFTDEYGNRIITIEQVQDKYDLTITRLEQIRKETIMKMRSKIGIKKLKEFI